MTKNEFEETASSMEANEVEIPTSSETAQVAETTPSTRKSINETTISEFNWVNFPKAEAIDESTDEIKISDYFSEGPCEENNFLIAKTRATGEEFYLGIDKKTETNKGDQFVIDGSVGDQGNSRLRLNSWEQVYKMSRLVKYCKEMNFTIVGQVVTFKRVNSGRSNAGKNWELILPNLKKKITGKDCLIEELK